MISPIYAFQATPQNEVSSFNNIERPALSDREQELHNIIGKAV